ncbi:hypothetical protein SERLADRAFT_405939 [Serpula lacrymans var. lacrymans S7.9]|uniref:Uncharacterized protein n=1 Tax=Serpula lacrymans var. lacrymans (strain S7.9) TaxID=578457 RepID=F8NKA6_SERL9|nr:uncharacterized protein SERLADRAFT_405939 [Serpula lacrymans var. lacrymans S7.9]EGO28372.1 hypothetical protein SERLADRAFT_405939 [Serpula lacrymans var. lacrymans S7.9]
MTLMGNMEEAIKYSSYNKFTISLTFGCNLTMQCNRTSRVPDGFIGRWFYSKGDYKMLMLMEAMLVHIMEIEEHSELVEDTGDEDSENEEENGSSSSGEEEDIQVTDVSARKSQLPKKEESLQPGSRKISAM